MSVSHELGGLLLSLTGVKSLANHDVMRACIQLRATSPILYVLVAPVLELAALSYGLTAT